MQTTVQQMNEDIYHAFGYDKISFHALYNFTPAPVSATEIGTLEQIETPNPDTGATYVIRWTLTPADVWAIASTITAPKEITRTGFYRNAGGNTITVTLKTTINPLPKFNVDYNDDPAQSDYIAQYWISHKHDATFAADGAHAQWDATAYHVATPEVGSVDATKCTFVNDINASFITNDGSVAAYPAGTLKVVKEGVALANIQYFFHPTKNKVDNHTFVKPGDDLNKSEHIYIRVAAADEGANEGLILYAHKGVLTTAEAALTPAQANAAGIVYDPIAVITNNPAGPVGQYITCTYQENDLAKELLNTDGFYAYIGATGDLCTAGSGFQVPIYFHGEEWFKANFLRPVSIETHTPAAFVDAVDFGNAGSYIRYEDIVKPYDWRLDWNGYDSHFDPNHVNYWQFYGLAPAPYHFIVHADLAGATCNLGGAGSPIPATIVLQANEMDNDATYALESWTTPVALTTANDADWYTDLAGDNTKVYSYNLTTATPLEYTLTAADIAANKQTQLGYLTYNNNGTAVGAFEITVPMVVFYKWGKLTTKVTIDVKETI